jgi:alcohol dehydrogenase YqhD (iron-dependent ADH family)
LFRNPLKDNMKKVVAVVTAHNETLVLAVAGGWDLGGSRVFRKTRLTAWRASTLFVLTERMYSL